MQLDESVRSLEAATKRAAEENDRLFERVAALTDEIARRDAYIASERTAGQTVVLPGQTTTLAGQTAVERTLNETKRDVWSTYIGTHE